MRTRIKKLIFEVTYLIPVFILNYMILTEMFSSDKEKLSSAVMTIMLSACIGVSMTNLIKEIQEFILYLRTRKDRRTTALDICPKCKGVGWVDWVEQITGKKEGRIRNEQSP